MLFEHIGPEDASIPPFTLEIGDAAQSTDARVRVIADTYEAVLALAEQGSAGPAIHPRPMGTFLVTCRSDARDEKSYTIYPVTMRVILAQIRQAFQMQHAAMPGTLTILETLLKSA